MAQASDYIGIKLWHESSGSMDYYWQALQEKAFETRAPLDAIYQGFTSKRWMTVGELDPDHPFRALYDREIAGGSKKA